MSGATHPAITTTGCSPNSARPTRPAGFRDADRARHYDLGFTRSASQEAASRGVRRVGITSLGLGYEGEVGLLSAALAMDELMEGSGVPYRALALPFFVENLLRQAQPMAERGAFSMANAADRPLLTVAPPGRCRRRGSTPAEPDSSKSPSHGGR
ncbi:hypothetical protein [Streptomyces flavofungini]|uniref:hypothetical protein n=1 Tax=Streptomyces flavofungini TaxID=68200 RepID=UPI00198BD122|nr:hypothetical protein [Streptomyces flavofungini]GHC84403.1 hypothetical protein GCM10010349_69400 [Streptomyces flavofungini]